jgi:hypothetical protein
MKLRKKKNNFIYFYTYISLKKLKVLYVYIYAYVKLYNFIRLHHYKKIYFFFNIKCDFMLIINPFLKINRISLKNILEFLEKLKYFLDSYIFYIIIKTLFLINSYFLINLKKIINDTPFFSYSVYIYMQCNFTIILIFY